MKFELRKPFVTDARRVEVDPGLAPGRYVFRLQVLNDRGVMSSPEHHVVVVTNPNSGDPNLGGGPAIHDPLRPERLTDPIHRPTPIPEPDPGPRPVLHPGTGTIVSPARPTNPTPNPATGTVGRVPGTTRPKVIRRPSRRPDPTP